MSFNTSAKKVRQTELPFTIRRRAFRSCLESYHWLTHRGFNSTYSRYSSEFGFDADTLDVGERLNLAMDALDEERNIFLEQLQLWQQSRRLEKWRVKEKARALNRPIS